MLKVFLFNLFINRASPAITQYVGKAIVKAGTFVGGWLVAHGVMGADPYVTAIAGGLAGLVALGVDFARTRYGGAIVKVVSQ